MLAACNPTLPPVTGTPVPWLDDTYRGPQITPVATADLEAAHGRCDLSQLGLSFEGWDTGDTRGTVGWIVARTTGSETCLLKELAAVTLIDSAGQVMSTGEAGDGPNGPAVLAPGLTDPTSAPSLGPLGYELTRGYGYEEIRVSGFCDAGRTAAALGVTLHGRPEVRFTVPPLPASSCSTDIGQVVMDWPFRSLEAPLPTVLPASRLEATAVLPSEATIGQVMPFTVALQNHYDVPISLRPCPVYTISYALIDSNGQESNRTDREYTLNCNGIESVGPKAAVAFDMELTVPASTPATDSLVVWWWIGTSDNPTMIYVKKPVRLVPPKG